MYTLDASTLSAYQQYKLLSASIIPRAIAWVTTLTPSGVVNLAPFSFFSGVSDQLPLLSITTLRRHQQPKDTAANLLGQKEAVIHLVTAAFAERMNQTAAALAPEVSEATGLNLVPSRQVAPPGIDGAPLRLEVTLYQHVPVAAPDGHVLSDLFILEVVAFHFAETVFDPKSYYLDPKALAPLARLAGPTYAMLGRTFTMQRPL